VNPRRRRRRAYRSNPSHAGGLSLNPKRRRSRRRSFRRNPGGAVTSWLLAGAAAVATTILATPILNAVVPESFRARPILYPATLMGLGVAAGLGLQKVGMPTLAVGIGLPILTLGGFLMYVGVSAMYSKASAPAANRSFRSAYEAGKISGPTMGALAAWTPRQVGMGAVLQGSGYSTMAAVEAMVGDRSARPVYYPRAGAELGAR
jgi:hypothetical protein